MMKKIMGKIHNFTIFSFSAFILDFLEFINSHLDYHLDIGLYQMAQQKVKSSSLQKESGNRTCHHKETHTPPKRQSHQKVGRISLGVCAMKKKVQSKPMKQILSRIKCKQVQIVQMWGCLDHHWSVWPKVDALICFYSDGFPYLMAWKYVKKHRPFLINSLQKQQLLWDRTVVYDIIKKIKVPVAKHYYILRDMQYIDSIQSKGFGKVIPDPLDLQTVPHHFDNKLRSADSADKYPGHKFKARMPSISPNIENLGIGAQVLHENYHLLQKMREDEAQHSNFHNAQKASITKNVPADSLPKIQMKYSQYVLEEEDNSSPTLLRRFAEKRGSHLKRYQIEECDDHILIKYGESVKKLLKPFVQKPFDSQNHQICVYYPESMGGGRKKLFRKVKDQSSLYQNINQIRKDDNYIYQQYLPTNAFDIKVYTIGPYYMYAEARRSPTLDGVVQRNQDGKEVRFPVILTPDEKFICNKIVQEFQQEVCGFDLLRANGKSYVCDVNGWSFVKGNPKYWEDCATILKKKILNHFFPGRGHDNVLLQGFNTQRQTQYSPIAPSINLFQKIQELRSIVSIFRHGDRSPKLKLKIKTSDSRFLQFFKDTHKDELKYKDGPNLTKFLNIAISIIAQLQQSDPLIKDYLQMKLVLESRGHFDGLTRKLQLKVLDRDANSNVKKILIVLKWGGELSYTGYLDAIALGEKMRKQRYDDHDLLSLYSSYRHDVKTYASDQGRCIKTAAAFLKGFLSIEGQLAPIISSLVQADSKAQRLLDCTSSQNHSVLTDELQGKLSQLMNSDQLLMDNYLKYVGDNTITDAMKEVIQAIGHPRQCLAELHDLLKALSREIKLVYQQDWQQQSMNQRKSRKQQLVDEQLCEDILFVDSRWLKLKKQFYDSQTCKYNISKIPDIYDTIRHDLRKNKLIFNLIDQSLLEHLQQLSRRLAYFVVVNEYGMNDWERLKIAQDICLPLIEKIKVDLMFWKEKSSQDNFWKYRNNAEIDNWRHIRTRLYFTSASHMYSLINLLTLGCSKELIRKTPAEQADKIMNILYMGYLSHIQFRLYENLMMEENDPNRFRMEISLSTQYKQQKQMKEFSLGGDEGFTINEICDFLQSFLKNEKDSTIPETSLPKF